MITRPDTPAPWTNYIGEDHYCGIVSNNAGGYSFRHSAGLGRLLRYRFNSIPSDRPGRYLYIRDESGDFWSNSWSPVQKPLSLQKVECRHGMGYTRISSIYNNIASDVTYFCPGNELVEIWDFSVRNDDSVQRTLDIFTYAEFGVPEFSRETDLQAYLYYWRTRFSDNAIEASLPRSKQGCENSFFTTSAPVVSYDTLREKFIGAWHSESNPVGVESGRCSNSTGNGENCCASLHVRIVLEPGQTTAIPFFLGSGTLDDAVHIRSIYTPENILRERAQLSEHWRERLDAFAIDTPDRELSSTIQTWCAYQAHVNFRWSRSASIIEAGGRDGLGYRDSLQDTLGIMHTFSARALARIKDLLRGQLSAGYSLHSLQPLTLVTGAGDTPRIQCCDDHLWIPLAVTAHIQETADLPSLDTVIDYYDSGSATIYDHMKQALIFSDRSRGTNGLLLGFGSDWNDSLGMRRTEAVSVWASMLFCRAAQDFAICARAMGRDDDAAWALSLDNAMKHIINAIGWDGGWYLRAIKKNGDLIGSHSNAEGSIYANPQLWSVIAGVADPDRAKEVLAVTREKLWTRHGVALCYPAYSSIDWDIGGMTLFPPSHKENGGVFCHINPWAVIAEAMAGNGDRAFEAFMNFLPAAYNSTAQIRKVEPYVYCQFIRGPQDPSHGEGHNPWLTGTSSWAFVAFSQYILGIRPTIKGLLIDPCIPTTWDQFTVRRLFRGTSYTITVHNPDHVSKGVKSIIVNGTSVDAKIVPVIIEGDDARVTVVMGT